MRPAKDIAIELIPRLLNEGGKLGMAELAMDYIKEAQIDALEEAAKIAAEFPHDGYVDHVTAFNVKWRIENVIRDKAKELKG